MKQKKILILMIITIFFTGCSAFKEDELLNEGKLALEKHEYTKAQDLLSQVLTADSTNENARSMYMQAVKMNDAAEYEEKQNYDKAIECLNVIENLKGGSSEIKNEEYKKSQEERKENAKDVSSKGQYKLEQDALKENQKQEALKEKEEQKAQEEENNQQDNKLENTQGDSSQENTGEVIQTPSNNQSQSSNTNQTHQPQKESQI